MHASRIGRSARLGVYLLLLAWGVSAAAGLDGAVEQSKARPDSTGTLLWYDARDIGVEGKGWTDTESFYDRLPARAKGVVRDEVWSLSHDAAGLLVRFRTDADTILVSWDGGGGMNHFAASGVSGLDLYVLKDGVWRYDWTGRPEETRTVRRIGRRNPGHAVRDCILHLPLYHPITKLEIGVPREASIARIPPPPGKPILFYGTSITQGGCAARPGMAYSNILGRWLNRGTINLGFSGNGMMEPEMARLMAELDPSVYVIDCIPNVGEKIGDLTVPFVKILRQKHPETPILLCEVPRPTDDQQNVLLRREFRKLVEGCDRAVYLLRGQDLLGDDDECTVDGVHPTDLGFFRMATAFKPALAVLLGLAPDEGK